MRPDAVLLDLSGTLHVGSIALPGAVDAVLRLQKAGIAVRAVSNTSRRPRSALVSLLAGMGFAFRAEEIFTAPLAARRLIEARGYRPWLLVHDDLLPEFAGLETHPPDAVLLADAGDGFSYAAMNAAFRLLQDGAAFVATGTNRCFRDGDALSLDAGPFVRALEFASGRPAELAGKPAPAFFHAALADIGCDPANAVMIGDDAENDVAGAIAAGLHGVLVKTGKFQPGDEARAGGAPCVTDLAAAIDRLLD